MNRVLALSAMILFLGVKLNSQNLIKPHKNPTETETKTQKNRFIFLFEAQSFTGFGTEKVAKNFKKQQFFSGAEGTLGLKRKDSQINFFFFVNLFYFHEKGIDNTPVGKPYIWNEQNMHGELGPGFKIEIPFNEKEVSGIKLVFKSNMLGYVNKKGILTFEPQVFFKKKFLTLSGGNKLELFRNGALQPFLTAGCEF